MDSQTQEQKDIIEIKDDLKSIRSHLDNIKKRQDNDDLTRIDTNRKIDMMYNSLVDNEFNGNQGYISVVRKLQEKVILHDLYWKILFAIILAGGVLTAVIKLLIPVK